MNEGQSGQGQQGGQAVEERAEHTQKPGFEPIGANEAGNSTVLPKFTTKASSPNERETLYALKVASIEAPATDGSRLIHLENEGYAPIRMEQRFFETFGVHPGGYLVSRATYWTYRDGTLFEAEYEPSR